MRPNDDFMSFGISAEVLGLLGTAAHALNLTAAEAFGRAIKDYDATRPGNYTHGTGDDAPKGYKLSQALQERMIILGMSSKHTQNDVATAVIRQFARHYPA